MNFKKVFENSASADSLGNQFRERRFMFIKQKLDLLPRPLKILDVGGTYSYWINRGYDNQPGVEITLLNIQLPEKTHPHIKSIIGDATDLSQFGDNSFDLVFSNSVIEHLYTWENQVKMAQEVMRVGKYFFVQTPNKYFIIEPHYLLPYFQFLPKKLRYFILTKTKLSRMIKWKPAKAKSYIDEIRLLSKGEMKKLFPDQKLYLENVVGFTKSFSSHNFPD